MINSLNYIKIMGQNILINNIIIKVSIYLLLVSEYKYNKKLKSINENIKVCKKWKIIIFLKKKKKKKKDK